MIEIVTIDTPSLGDRTYLATDGVGALVIDPQRDIDRVLAVAAARGVAVTHVFETHIHNDYVSGGLALARRTGAAYHVNAADTVAFSRVGIGDGDTIAVGRSMRVRVIATPGHTFTHLAYALEDAPTGEVEAVFTGGSLLHGSTGRPDLLGAEHTLTLAAAQHASARRLARSCRTGRRYARRMASAASAPPPRPVGRVHHRGGEEVQPGADPRGRQLRRRPGGGPGRLSGLLRAHGRGQRGRAAGPGPDPARPGIAERPPVGGSPPGNGWWICATGGLSRPGTFRARSASSTGTASPPTLAG